MNTMIQTPETLNERLDRLERILERLSELTIQNVQSQAAAEDRKIWQAATKSARKSQPITIDTIELERYLDQLVERKIKQVIANLNSSLPYLQAEDSLSVTEHQ